MRQFGGDPMGGGGPRQQRGRSRSAPRRRGADITQDVEIPFSLAVCGGPRQVTVQRGGELKTITVTIPAGIENGKRMRLSGQGESGAAGAGDLLLTIRVAPHPVYRRSGRDLDVRVPVTLQEAAAGAKIELPTPHGTVTLTVQPGTSSGTKLRLKGLGVRSKQGTGDLLAEIQVALPSPLDDDDLRAIEAIQRRHQDQAPRKDLMW
jgi:DnaJ-class molecular chaperone